MAAFPVATVPGDRDVDGVVGDDGGQLENNNNRSGDRTISVNYVARSQQWLDFTTRPLGCNR